MADDRAQATPKTSETAAVPEAQTETGNGAGKIGEPDFNIGPNAEYYVTRPDDLFTRLRSFIDTSRGGVFGLTGVRGAGKSVLLKKIEKEFAGKHHTLQIPAPVSSSEETAFFAMLFQQLCQSVISYINQQVFKKKTGSEKQGRDELRKRLYLLLFFLPVFAAGGYGGWFYWTFYSDYKTQEQSMLGELVKETASLRKTHENGVNGIVSTVTEDILAAARDVSRTVASAVAEKAVAVNEMEEKVAWARIEVADVDEQLRFLAALRKWEGPFADEFGIWQKVIGDMPHPAHVLYFDDLGKKGGPFTLKIFVDGRNKRKVPFADLVKELGLSESQGRRLLTAFRKDSEEWKRKDLSARWIPTLVKRGSDSFSIIRRRLDQSMSKVQRDFGSSRRSSQDTLNKLLQATKALNEERKIVAARGGKEAEVAFGKAELKALAEEKNIRDLAVPVAEAIDELGSYAETIVFDLWRFDTWRSPLLPIEKHVEQKKNDKLFGKLMVGIDDKRTTFVTKFVNLDLINNSDKASVPYSDALKQAQGFLIDALDRIETSDIDFYRLRELGMGPLIVVGVAVGGGLVLVFFVFLGLKIRQALQHGDILGLLKRSEDIIRNLEYEVTQSRGGTLNLPLFQRLGASFSVSEKQRGRALTLPALTARYIEYIQDVQRVLGAKYGSPKLIICIDELDKITDPKQVGNVLREIKGALYEKDCFYLLSISEDAVRAFEGRLVEQRDIFESTFDEILFLERLDLATCVRIARERCKGTGYGPRDKVIPDIQEAMMIAAVLSTGVPRELLRNLRAVENIAGRVLDFEPSLAWHTLFRRKLRDILKNVRTAHGQEDVRADLIDEIENYLRRCDGGYDENVVRRCLSRVRKRTKALTAQSASLQTKADTADRKFRAVALESDIELIRAWIRCWIELEIHLLVRQCSIACATGDAQTRSGAYADLLDTYARLPYSTEATVRRLSQMTLPGTRAASE
ncbi:MAG: hypothetical protein O7A64_10800 [Alphaproteobacteria bacterium]|nr:hypothetical protein [Alphaproteobacteria bacterium]